MLKPHIFEKKLATENIFKFWATKHNFLSKKKFELAKNNLFDIFNFVLNFTHVLASIGISFKERLFKNFFYII